MPNSEEVHLNSFDVSNLMMNHLNPLEEILR